MQKVGILTLPLNHNYGGIMQALALCHTVAKLGYEPYLITARVPIAKKNALSVRVKRFIKEGWRIWVMGNVDRIVGKTVDPVLKLLNPNYITYREYVNLAEDEFKVFIQSIFPNQLTSVPSYGANEAGLSAVIVGSDQVWRRQYAHNVKWFFLSFAEGWNVRRVAYAASFGKPEWEGAPEETAECARLLKMFDAVSTREDDGVNLCRELFGTEAVQMIDPTMLLNPADYLSLTTEATSPGAEFVTYLLDNNEAKTEILSALEKEVGSKSKSLNKWHPVNDKRKMEALLSVPEWTKALADAKFVFTDSFHGCVFSIIFNKPFAVVVNARRGSSRFGTLLSKFGLEDRLVSSAEEAVRIAREPIDWEAVNAKRVALRENSLKFLTEALKGKQ